MAWFPALSLAPFRSSGQPSEVAQLDLEIAGASPSGNQPVRWQVEYPHAGAPSSAVADIIVSHKDLEAIVPLAMVSDPTCTHWIPCPLPGDPHAVWCPTHPHIWDPQDTTLLPPTCIQLKGPLRACAPVSRG